MQAIAPEISAMKKALIIRPGAIGDVILTTPFIRALKKANPGLQIDYLAAPFPAKALLGNPYLSRVIVFDKNELKKGGPFATIINTLKYYLYLRKQRYDVVFDLFGNMRTAVIALFTGARHRIGFTFRVRKHLYTIKVKPDPKPKYNVWYHLDLLKALQVPDDGDRTDFVVSPESEKKAAEFFRAFNPEGRPVIGLNPSGTWPTKRWPLKRFAELAIMLSVDMPQYLMLVLWGPGEKEQAAEIVKLSGLNGKIAIAPETSLNEMAAVISSLKVLVTNDGGPKHIASARGVPTVTVFGPTNSRSWNEENDPAHPAVTSKESCAPCDRTQCEDYGIKCMESIKAEEVLEKLKKVIEFIDKGEQHGRA